MQENIRDFFELLMKWRQKINLSTVQDFPEFEQKHVIDAKVAIEFIKKNSCLIDLGTGAGLPGILIKIMRPDVSVTLVDSTRKKVSFCEEAIRKLDLKGIKTHWGRVEDENVVGSLGKFDVVISRATWGLGNYLELAQRYLSADGMCIALKGDKWREELNGARETIQRLMLELKNEKEYRLASGELRVLLVFS